uniref:Uncharacterized protein n=1 Tax=Eptatretus burgeri TaxID=7764 RepID=A0A8C4QNP1_EPTBU
KNNKTHEAECGGVVLRCRPLDSRSPRVNLRQSLRAVNDIDEEEEGEGECFLKPPDQLVLTSEELNEEIPRTLTTSNPQAPRNITSYSYQEQAFVQSMVDDLVVHFILEGDLHVEQSSEASQQRCTGMKDTRQEHEEEVGKEQDGDEMQTDKV